MLVIPNYAYQHRSQRADPRPNRIGCTDGDAPRSQLQKAHATDDADQKSQRPRDVSKTVGIDSAGRW